MQVEESYNLEGGGLKRMLDQEILIQEGIVHSLAANFFFLFG